jgi:hypothetical protein
VARDDLAGVLKQQKQELERLILQAEGKAIAADDFLMQVGLKWAESKQAGRR